MHRDYEKLYKEKIRENKRQDLQIKKLTNRIEILEKALNKLQKEIDYDLLTGAMLRRGIQTFLAKTNIPEFIILNIDIDNFKNVNDTMGHDQGDQALKEIVNIFEKNTRQSDAIVRYGGDEFCIFFANSNINDIFIRSHSIQQAIIAYGKQLYEKNNKKIPPGKELSMSAGVTIFDKATDNLEELLKGTDDKILESKHSGKGQITIYEKEKNNQLKRNRIVE